MQTITPLPIDAFDPYSVLSQHQQYVLTVLQIVGGTISMVGSLFIVFSFAFLGRLKQTFFLKQVFVLSIADIFSDINAFLPTVHEPNSALCNFKGWYMETFDLWPALWTACISFHLYCSVFVWTDARSWEGPKLWAAYLSFSLGLPLVFSFGSLAGSAFGWAEWACWLKFRSLQFLLFYVPIVLVIGYNMVVYFLLTREFKKIFGQHSQQRSLGRQRRLLIYPLILLFVWGPMFLHRVIMGAVGRPIFGILCFAMPLSRMQGVANAVVYGGDPELLDEFKRHIAGIMGWEMPPAVVEEPGSPYEMTSDEPAAAPVALPSNTGSAVPDIYLPPPTVISKSRLSDD